jgi:hypothetical protein
MSQPFNMLLMPILPGDESIMALHNRLCFDQECDKESDLSNDELNSVMIWREKELCRWNALTLVGVHLMGGTDSQGYQPSENTLERWAIVIRRLKIAFYLADKLFPYDEINLSNNEYVGPCPDLRCAMMVNMYKFTALSDGEMFYWPSML